MTRLSHGALISIIKSLTYAHRVLGGCIHTHINWIFLSYGFYFDM